MKHCLEGSRALALPAGALASSAEEQLLEVLGDNNKEEENVEEVKATLQCIVGMSLHAR